MGSGACAWRGSVMSLRQPVSVSETSEAWPKRVASSSDAPPDTSFLPAVLEMLREFLRRSRFHESATERSDAKP